MINFPLNSLHHEAPQSIWRRTAHSGDDDNPSFPEDSKVDIHIDSYSDLSPGTEMMKAKVDTSKWVRYDIDLFRKEETGHVLTTLAEDLAKLSVGDRERIYEELHGIVKTNDVPIEENTPALDALIDSLRNILVQERSSFPLVDLAFRQFPSRISSRSFLLMYLRATEYKVEATAARIRLNLELQDLLFGREKVGKRITLDDMSEKDMHALRSSFFQVLPQKDSAGRSVFFDSISHRTWAEHGHSMVSSSNEKHAKEIVLEAFLIINVPLLHLSIIDQYQVRAGWWLFMSKVEYDEILQHRGIILIMSYLGDIRSDFGTPTSNAESYRLTELAFRSLPLFDRGVHVLMNPSVYVRVFDFLRSHLRSSRFRTRVHQGTLQECKYILKTFGIPANLIPMSDDFSLQNEYHLRHLRNQREFERRFSNMERSMMNTDYDVDRCDTTTMISTPSPKDVLFGRGWKIQNHPGNIHLNLLCHAARSDYDDARGRTKKREISGSILNSIRRDGGRFLKPVATSGDGGYWHVTNDNDAFTKISATFRGLRLLDRLKKEKKHSALPVVTSAMPPTSDTDVIVNDEISLHKNMVGEEDKQLSGQDNNIHPSGVPSSSMSPLLGACLPSFPDCADEQNKGVEYQWTQL